MKLLRSRRSFGGLIALGVVVVPTLAFAQGQASWTSIGSMPFERAEIAVVEVSGKIIRHRRADARG